MLRNHFSHQSKHNDNNKIGSVTALLINYLSIADQLNWRATCRVNRDGVQRAQRGPYQGKAVFAMAVTGLFYSRTTALLERAWGYYAAIVRAESMQPAMLYRLSERSRKNSRFTQKLIHFKAGDDIEQQERVYKPPYYDHFWAYNLVWMLAQIHKGRAFAVLSDITKENLKSKSKWFARSAFAKEITAALLAGYVATPAHDDSIALSPPDQAIASAITIADLQMEDKVIQEKYYALQPLQKLDPYLQKSSIYYPAFRRRK